MKKLILLVVFSIFWQPTIQAYEHFNLFNKAPNYFKSLISSGTDLYTQDNAASTINEVNATSGWSGYDGVIESVATSPYNGNYCLRVTSSEANYGEKRYHFDVLSGETYTVTIYAKRGSVGDQQELVLFGTSIATQSQFVTTQTWTGYTFTINPTADGTITIQAYVFKNNGSTAQELFLDKISIIDNATADTEAPTVPTNLSSNNITSSSFTLSWGASTDNVAVSGYKIYKDNVLYTTIGNVTTLDVIGQTAQSSADWTVSAYDTEGNESAQSTVILVALTDSNSLLISNFRIESSTPNRIYFDSDIPITATTYTGFTVSGKTINSIVIQPGQTNGHYFGVSTAFNSWDNNTIRYEGGSDMVGINSNGVYDFTLTYINNNIPEPTPTGNVYFVDGNVTSSGNGSTEALAFKTLGEGIGAITGAGDKVWVKAYNYGAEFLTAPSMLGAIDNPIVIEGYKLTPGDITSNYYTPYVDEFDVTSALLDASEMPLFDGGNTSVGIGLNLTSPSPTTASNYLIVKNLQFTNYLKGVDTSSNCKDVIFERIIVKECGDLNNGDGYCFDLSHFEYNNERFRVIDCIAVNGSESMFEFKNQNGLMIGCEAYSERADGDYKFGISGSNNIVLNSHAENSSDIDFPGHGFSIKYISEYNLIDNCLAVNTENSFIARQETSKFNVFKNSEAHGNVVINPKGVFGCVIYGASSDNIFENLNLHHLELGIVMMDNGEGAVRSIGDNNTFRNILIDNVSDMGIQILNRLTSQSVNLSGTKFYNITFNNITNEFVQIGFTDRGGITMSNNEMKNCIVNGVGLGFTSATEYREPTPSELLFEYNDYFNFWGTNGVPETGTGNISVNPQFVSATDFHLQSTSPLIGAGITLNEVKYDFDGIPRPQGNNYDIGAYEFIGSEAKSVKEESIVVVGEQLILYPNPSQGVITIGFHAKVKREVFEITVFNLNGSLVFTSSIQNGGKSGTTKTFDLSHLTKGIYIFKAFNKTESFTKKILLH